MQSLGQGSSPSSIGYEGEPKHPRTSSSCPADSASCFGRRWGKRADGEQGGHGEHSFGGQKGCGRLSVEPNMSSYPHAALTYVRASQKEAFEKKLSSSLLSSPSTHILLSHKTSSPAQLMAADRSSEGVD